MSLPELIAIGLGGCLGALARFQIDRFISLKAETTFPLGTFVVNISGTFLLGLLAGLSLSHSAHQFFAVGLLGSYTTFSTWMLETHRMAEGGSERFAMVNVLASLVAGVFAIWLGRLLGGLL